VGDSKKAADVVNARPLLWLKEAVPATSPAVVEVIPATIGAVQESNELGLSNEASPLDKGTILSKPEVPIDPHSDPISEAEERSVEGRIIVKSTEPKTELCVS
jgi:hypothetical protein